MRTKIQKGISHSMRELNEVLLIEDNKDDVDLMRRGFEKFNLLNKVHVAESGEEAVEFIKKPHNLKLIILDVNLPKMDGFAVLKVIRKNKTTAITPVVLLTVDKTDSSIKKGYTLGANSYMVKPVDFNKFAEATSALGFYWYFLNELVEAQ